MADVTLLLTRARDGDREARDALAPLVYDELKRLAVAHVRREHRPDGVQATQLVSDAFMQLVGSTKGVDWESRGHFYAIASRCMRRLLVDRARARSRQKRGGDIEHVAYDETAVVSADSDADVLAVEEALAALEAVDPRQAEIVMMRFYGGMSMREVAEALGVSKRTADREWALIKAWMRRELSR